MTFVIGLARLEDAEPSPTLWSEAVRCLSPERQASIGRLRNPIDRRRSAAAETLLRWLLLEKVGWDGDRPIRFGRNAAGKPYLEDAPDLAFNLSHAGRWVACAVDDRPVGIDVEQILPIDAEGIAGRFFSRREYEALMEQPEEQRLSGFYRLWTLKESYVKAIGTGLSLSLNSSTVSAQDGSSEEASFFRVERDGAEPFRLMARQIDGDHWLSVCALRDRFPEPMILRETDLYASLLARPGRTGYR